MFASAHPFPVNTLLALTVAAIALPPLLLHGHRQGWKLSGTLKAAIALFVLIALLLLLDDLHIGWKWRTYEPHRPPNGYGKPWWYPTYWQVILRYALTALGGSSVITLGYAALTRTGGTTRL